MQDIAASSTLANQVCTEEPTVVLDKRDEQAYTIRRINGTCWMVENLKLGYDASNPSEPTISGLDCTNTNISSEYTPSNQLALNLYDFEKHGTKTTGECWGETGATEVGGGFNNLCIHSGTDNNGNPTVWYNYGAASAGTILQSTSTNPQVYDICPSGWRLPTATESLGVSGYVDEYNPVYGGYWSTLSNNDPLSLINSSSRSLYWTSTYNDSSSRYYQNYQDGAINAGATGRRRSGFFVRCIMKDTGIGSLTYMQDFAKLDSTKKSQVINSMELNSTTGYTLKDIRDSQEYTIKKLGPSSDTDKQKIWMTKNLAIGCSSNSISQHTLNSADSNISSGSSFTTPSNLLSSASASTETADYTTARMQCSSTYGAWYNYAAASAGKITGTSNTNDENTSGFVWQDVCPLGWKIPNSSETSILYGTDYVSSTSFNPSVGGYYRDGTLSESTHSYIWASTQYSATWRYFLGYNGTSLSNGASGVRYDGYFVRCIAK